MKLEQLASGIQIGIADKDIQVYLQRHPFGIGNRFDLNRAALIKLRLGLHVRPQAVVPELHSADPDDLNLTRLERESVTRWFGRLKVDDAQQAWAWQSLAWKITRLPRDAGSVLSIGCGEGIELILIRALLPQAQLFAVDFDDKIPCGFKDALGLQFSKGHFNDFLARSEGLFDVVFCNHVLEHLFEPEVTLTLIRRSLRPGGRLVAGLPMEGCSDGVFASSMQHMASKPFALHTLDVGVLDAGHAWKTNPADLKATLEKQEFGRVELYLRKTEHGFRIAISRRTGMVLYACSFGCVRRVLKLLSPEVTPDLLIRWFLALERRCWFGANRLKNRFAKEVLVQARVRQAETLRT